MQAFKWCLVCVFLVQLLSCNHNDSRTDKFYTRGGDWDCIYTPFIKPYRAVLLNGSEDWMMNFHYSLDAGSADSIQRVNVIEGTILLYCTNTLLRGNKVREAWFVAIPAKHLEKGFGNHNDYVKFLKENNIAAEPRLFDMNYVSDYFNDHAPIDWVMLNKIHSKNAAGK